MKLSRKVRRKAAAVLSADDRVSAAGDLVEFDEIVEDRGASLYRVRMKAQSLRRLTHAFWEREQAIQALRRAMRARTWEDVLKVVAIAGERRKARAVSVAEGA